LYVFAVSLFVLMVYLIKNKTSFKDMAVRLFYIVIPASLIYLGWAIFSWQHYNSVLGSMGFQPLAETHPTIGWYINYNFMSIKGLHRFYDLWVKMYWAKFGWLDTVFSSFWLYKLLFLIMIVSFIGVLKGILKRKQNKIWIFVLFYFGNLAFLCIAEMTYTIKFNALMLQGRYLFTALVPLNILIILGLSYLVKTKKYVYILLSSGMVIFNIASFVVIYQRYYVVG
jgi:hypothetical protein